MAINIFTDQMQHAQLFGKPVLTTNWLIPRETVPDGWHCYDMQGTDRDPAAHVALVDHADFNHSGAVLSPEPLKQPSVASRRIGKRDYFLHGEEMDLEAFCEEYGLDVPDNPIKFEIRPASPNEAGIFYALEPEEDEKLGTIGHVRIDFGHGGDGFWHSWWPRGPEELNSPEFKGELDQVMDQLRRGVLKDLSSMRRWCCTHGGGISESWPQNYGYVVETERYRYCLRCNPVKDDYQAYLTCFDRREQQMGLTEKGRQTLEGQAVGRISFANGEQVSFTDPQEYIAAIREELPYHPTTGFRYETLTSDPEVRRAVDAELYDLYGMEPPEIADKEQNMTMGEMSL